MFFEQLSVGFGICLDEDVEVLEDLNSLNCTWIVVVWVFESNVLIKPMG